MLQQTPTVCMTEYSEMNSEYLTIQQAHLQQVFQGLTSPIVVCNFCTLKTVMGGIFLVFQVPIKHLSCPCRNFEIYFYPVTPPSSLTLHLVLLHRDLNFSGFSALFLSLIITNNLKNCHSIQGTALILRPLKYFPQISQFTILYISLLQSQDMSNILTMSLFVFVLVLCHSVMNMT